MWPWWKFGPHHFHFWPQLKRFRLFFRKYTRLKAKGQVSAFDYFYFWEVWVVVFSWLRQWQHVIMTMLHSWQEHGQRQKNVSGWLFFWNWQMMMCRLRIQKLKIGQWGGFEEKVILVSENDLFLTLGLGNSNARNENLRPLLNKNIPLISGNYGLRNHFWPLESCFLMGENEKKSIFSKTP